MKVVLVSLVEKAMHRITDQIWESTQMKGDLPDLSMNIMRRLRQLQLNDLIQEQRKV